MKTISLLDGREYEIPPKAPRPVWVDITPDEISQLAPTFGLHDTSVEDCLNQERRPKVEEYGSYLSVTANLYDGSAIREFNIFLGRDFLISVHQTEVPEPTAPVRSRVYDLGPAALLHWLLDWVVDSFLPPLEEIRGQLEELDEMILANPRQTVIGSMFVLRRRMLNLSRSLIAQEQMLRLAISLESLTGEKQLKHYFADVHDHAVKMAEMMENLTEHLALSTEAYLASAANRTSEVTRLLASIATIFLPLTLIASIYGMNFKLMPGLELSYGPYAVLAFMAVTGSAVYFYFRRRGWI